MIYRQQNPVEAEAEDLRNDPVAMEAAKQQQAEMRPTLDKVIENLDNTYMRLIRGEQAPVMRTKRQHAKVKP